jgi:hypothetical protein
MDILVTARLSIRRDDVGQVVDWQPLIKKYGNQGVPIEEFEQLLIKGMVEDLQGSVVQVRTGILQLITAGRILEVKEIKQKGKVLYPPPIAKDGTMDFSKSPTILGE